jgi:8-oxo-dGTP pyrophosphatase MutT (NUDIX family)
MLDFLRLLTRRWRPSDGSKASLLRLQSELESERATADVVLVGMVTFHDDSILLLRRSTREKFLPGVWSLPAGKVAPGEPLADAALRELKEEAGVHGNVCRILGTAWFDSDYNGRRVRNLQINFAVEALSRDVHLDRSSDDFMWLPTSKLSDPPVPLDDFTRVAVNSALSGTLRA